jgi:hypothetical protein
MAIASSTKNIENLLLLSRAARMAVTAPGIPS